MAKDRPKAVERASGHFAPTEKGRQKHLACVDTLDPTDIIDRIEYQASTDGGAIWRTIAFVTEARAAPSPLSGVMQPPGVCVEVDVGVGAIFRTVAMDGTGKGRTVSAKGVN